MSSPRVRVDVAILGKRNEDVIPAAFIARWSPFFAGENKPDLAKLRRQLRRGHERHLTVGLRYHPKLGFALTPIKPSHVPTQKLHEFASHHRTAVTAKNSMSKGSLPVQPIALRATALLRARPTPPMVAWPISSELPGLTTESTAASTSSSPGERRRKSAGLRCTWTLRTDADTDMATGRRSGRQGRATEALTVQAIRRSPHADNGHCRCNRCCSGQGSGREFRLGSGERARP